MKRQLFSIVLFLLQMTKLNDLTLSELVTKPKYPKEFLPWRTEFTKGITSLGLNHKFMVLSFVKKSFKLTPDLT